MKTSFSLETTPKELLLHSHHTDEATEAREAGRPLPRLPHQIQPQGQSLYQLPTQPHLNTDPYMSMGAEGQSYIQHGYCSLTFHGSMLMWEDVLAHSSGLGSKLNSYQDASPGIQPMGQFMSSTRSTGIPRLHPITDSKSASPTACWPQNTCPGNTTQKPFQTR